MKHTSKAKKGKAAASAKVQKAIHQIVFSKDKFTTKADVEKTLKDEGYSYRSVEETRKSFVVRGVAESAFKKIDAVQIDHVSGMTVHMGVLKDDFVSKDDEPEDEAEADTEADTSEDEDKDEDATDDSEDDSDEDAEEDTAKTQTPKISGKKTITEDGPKKKIKPVPGKNASIKPPTPVKKDDSEDLLEGVEGADEFREHVAKMDHYESRRTGVKSIREVLKSGEPTLPGFYDVSGAFSIVVGNILKDDESSAEALDTAIEEYGTFIRRLYKSLNGVAKTDREELVQKAFDLPEEDEDDVNPGAQFEDRPLTKAERLALEAELSKDDEDEDSDEDDSDEDSEDEEETEDDDTNEDSDKDESADDSEEEDEDESEEDDDEEEEDENAVEKAVARVLTPMIQKLSTKMDKSLGVLHKSVDSIAKDADANFERLDSQITDGQKRLYQLENIEQTKKGTAHDESAAASSVKKSAETPKPDASMAKLQRNLIGR